MTRFVKTLDTKESTREEVFEKRKAIARSSWG